VQEFTDNDVSASSKKPRPAYTAMLAAIERGEADVLVAWHVDRLTRKITDLEHLIEVAQQTGLRIATVTGDLDLSTDAGRLVGRILASVARGEVERKGARQKRAQQQAAQLGKPAGGRRAFGYATDGMAVVADEAREIKSAYQSLLHGASLKSIARRWNDAALRTTMGNTWTHSTVRRTLTNPRYAGLRAYRGEIIGLATWPPLVDEDTHKSAVALLSLPERRTTTTTARKYLLPALALCGRCGSDMATGHTRHGHRVYVCRAKKCISRKAPPVDELIEAVVIARLERPDAAELLTPSKDPDVDVFRARAQAIRERLDDLAIGLEEGVLTLAAVRRSSTRLQAELAEADARVQSGTHADVLRPLVTAPDVGKAWDACDLQQKRAVIETLMQITLLPPERGHQSFDPDTVQIEWKGCAR